MVGGTFTDFVMARFIAEGTLDPSFGKGGMVTTDIQPDQQEESLAVAVAPRWQDRGRRLQRLRRHAWRSPGTCPTAAWTPRSGRRQGRGHAPGRLLRGRRPAGRAIVVAGGRDIPDGTVDFSRPAGRAVSSPTARSTPPSVTRAVVVDGCRRRDEHGANRGPARRPDRGQRRERRELRGSERTDLVRLTSGRLARPDLR